MYNTLIFEPLYNGLVGIMDLLPWIDLGMAVIIFTIIVKLALFHLSKSSILTQVKMKEVEPEANKIKAQYANDRQTQALKIMELYKSKGIKPFAGILLLIIQLPILLALLSVFYKIIPTINPDYLYSFVSMPSVKTMFLGLIDLTKPSLILAIMTAVAQFVQLHFSLASKQFKPATVNKDQTGTPPLDFAASMNKQMKYMLPALAFISTYWLIPAKFPQAASIIALYWSVSALFTLGQELVIRKRYLKK
ncbi:membrane protein insertase YidC [Patescibacteria group bacterium]|nr:membrane protein insertase YidC [Patescibacteria group bacterium]MDE1946642.1 membrane protein insertase YidC [Patescibacteria group bacterium]MDE2010595.1 membrane protein insertase YidC [Patescibacteria group bacterium]MDE2232958.1 membrane protein insertase YidC [Patescibacteria group bacterium]